MVNRSATDAAPPATPIAPVVKRKRRASCLGEQERRERKRAIDREAQRSLREKTKTHIADLERTIQILREQDRNGATASLLSEIDSLRAENERLRDVIDSVKSLVGSEIFPRNNSTANPPPASSQGSPGPNSGGQPSPRGQAIAISTASDTKPTLASATTQSVPEDSAITRFEPMNFVQHASPTARRVDLDGMVMQTDLVHPHPHTAKLNLQLNLEPVSEILERNEEANMFDAPDSPTTAAFAPFMSELFGPSWRCPSPVVLHIGNPAGASTPTTPNAICPIWKKSNELFGKVFLHRPGTAALNADSIEAGLLYMGIKDGWSSFTEWSQSPALKILKEVDQFLFRNLPKIQRLAVAYKSFKLLKYYLNATKEELEKVPEWLRPSSTQSRTKHPVAVDFFAWPTLRDRLVSTHGSVFSNQEMSHAYGNYLRFQWPFSFEDAFFYDDLCQAYYPSPLFERYHRDLKYWTVTQEFYDKFPEMIMDIEGDRARFSEVET
ncbi:hypothetical protein BU24DRAFT_362360 [Aaosphaeria arxii CBS 175.79]|uniref:BZIP domain-containing protein n=1 Tax=Aaosphaeria arxii CBS 175.79 TaxID=1450172 RepID=A0A6A5Y7U1_9PLEO|nr:uncharacterized protein BU24DRAFT_362360 [Aaosphaeria arxii CBS 175.79]KAF2021645.1 hypothetical protein BU24DRAFT_362360 [Aaosphaeria arxii CBS 175.79]